MFLGFIKRPRIWRVPSFFPTSFLLGWMSIVVLSPSATAGDGGAKAKDWVGAVGVQQTTADIMLQQSINDAIRLETDGTPKKITKHGKWGARIGLTMNPNSPSVASSPSAGAPGGGGAGAPLDAAQVNINFTGATLTDTSAFPPDSMGTVGPAQYIVAVNGRLRTFDKTTGVADGVLDSDMDTFFNSVMTPPVNNNFTSDPRIRYDRLAGKWIVIIIDVPGQSGTLPNRILLAVSDSGIISASTVWTYFFFQQDLVSTTGDTGKFADYPTLGIDANALYIGVNIFNSSGSFFNTTGFVVRKSSILGAGPIVVKAFRKLISNQGTGMYTPQGVDNFDPAATEGYFIGVDASAFGKLDLRRVSSPGGTPTISANVAITVPTTAVPLTVPHQGNTGGSNGNVDGLDDRLLAAHFRNGRLWTTHSIEVDNTGVASSSGSRNGVRWYELSGIPTGQTPSVVESGTVFQPSANNSTDQRYYWMGTVMVSGQGHAALGCSAAGVNEFINAGTAFRLAGETLGTMHAPSLYTASSTAYNPPSDTGSAGSRRWGDYSYTSLDPSDDMTMWTIQEFCDRTDSYGVQVLKIYAPLPAAPTNCNPATVQSGATNVNLVVIGSTNGGAGFFDPAAAIPNHIAATVSGGGVTVTKVTYTDPAHITLTVNVSPGAVAGARTITVINPDSQAVTSSTSLLTVLISNSNTPPVLTVITNQTINELNLLTFIATANDSDLPAQTLAFTLDPGAPAGASINPTNGVFTWTPTEAQGPGTNLITVRVTDNGSPPLSDTKSFTVVVNEVNSAPALAAIANQVINENSTLTVTNLTTDGDIPANTLAYSLDPGAPAGASINTTNGVFTWTPTEAQGPGTNVITVRVTDNGSPPLSDAKSFTVVVNEVNSAPVLTFIPDQTIFEGSTLVVTSSASDADLPINTLNFSLDPGAPVGASINPTNGLFVWTPTEAQGGTTNHVTVRVTDNGVPNLSDFKNFTVTVGKTNSPPTLAGIADQIIAEGNALSITNTATDTDIPTNILSFSLDPGAPVGANIDSATGIFTWTPSEAQGPSTNVVTVRVTDNGVPVLSDSKTFTIVVSEVNVAPVLAAVADRTIHAGFTLVITNSATDADIPTNTLTFSLDAGAPAGATIQSDTGIFNWTPTDGQAGTTNAITVRVTDNGVPPLNDAKSFNVTVVSRPTIENISVSSSDVTLTWTSVAGNVYRVQSKADVQAAWNDLPGDLTATGTTSTKVDSSGLVTQQYYRVMLVQ